METEQLSAECRHCTVAVDLADGSRVFPFAGRSAFESSLTDAILTGGMNDSLEAV
jgi:hypothetical protein